MGNSDSGSHENRRGLAGTQGAYSIQEQSPGRDAEVGLGCQGQVPKKTFQSTPVA